MRFDGNDLENWQRLEELLWSLFEDGTRVHIPSGAFQEQAMRETTFQNSNMA